MISNENFESGPIVWAAIGIYSHLWTFDDLVKFQFGAFARFFVRGNPCGETREPCSLFNMCDRPPDATPSS